ASATLVEFSDFQCPACAAFQPTVKEILSKYGSKIRFIYRHFPLQQHQFSYPSALAAEAAGLQGKFWEMHDLLFENQNSLSENTGGDLASKLKLDMDQFTSDLKSKEVKDRVDRDRADGIRLGIDATPTFYLNAVKLNLQNPQDLIAQVESALQIR
ncbi:hypothetical protein A2154_03360, partial [Candidatus Gottesmanbacteria bacterium RBG_16_43_7]